MSYNLTLAGQLAIVSDPSQTDADLSGDPDIKAPLSLAFTLSAKESQTVALTVTDAVPDPITVSLDGIEQAEFLMISTTVPAELGIKTAEGPTYYTVYMNKLFILDCREEAVTGLTIETRTVAGVARVTMGRV